MNELSQSKIKKSVRTVSVLLVLFFLFGMCGTRAALAAGPDDNTGTGERIRSALLEILENRAASSGCSDIRSWAAEKLSGSAGTGAEWSVIALSQSGVTDFGDYRSALGSYLSEKGSGLSAVTKQKYALALAAACGPDQMSGEIGKGTADGDAVMSLVFGLHLCNNGIKVSDDFGADELVRRILSVQKEDGGWAVFGERGDVDVTAMTLCALAGAERSSDDVSDAVERALLFLSGRQEITGDFASFGSRNAESTAQVILALSSLGIDPFGDSRFIKEQGDLLDGILLYRTEGGYSHTVGGNAEDGTTDQVMMAFVSCLRRLEGRSPFFVLDACTGAERTDLIGAEETKDPSVTETEGPGGSEDERSGGPDVRIFIVAGIFAAAAAAYAVLFFTGRRNVKNAVLIFSAALVLSALVFLLRFESAESFYGSGTEPDVPAGTAVISIRCDTIAGSSGSSVVPADGTVLEPTEIAFAEGETVYDLLVRAVRKFGIHMDSSGSGGMVYVSGIAHIYEFEYGELSGWMFYVNGVSSPVGCASYRLSDGDRVEWMYSRNIGKDLP